MSLVVGLGALRRATTAIALSLLVLGCSQSETAAVSTSEKASTAAGSGIVGEWTLSIDTPRGVQNPKLLITAADGGYSGTYSSRQGTSFIQEVTVDGGQFSFPMELTIPIGTIEVRYTGQIDGDQMQGFVENPRGQVPFSGVRSGSG